MFSAHHLVYVAAHGSRAAPEAQALQGCPASDDTLFTGTSGPGTERVQQG